MQIKINFINAVGFHADSGMSVILMHDRLSIVTLFYLDHLDWSRHNTNQYNIYEFMKHAACKHGRLI